MKARVTIGGQESYPFEVSAGIKQGIVLTPVIFNLFLVAVTLVFRSGLLVQAPGHTTLFFDIYDVFCCFLSTNVC